MTMQEPNLVSDRKKLERLGSKEYRDSYLSSQVHTWIAYQFQALRKKFGLSQREMAERTGKTQSIISRLESTDYGRVTVQTLLDVANSLDVALLVQFVSYPDFLHRTRDKSESSMQPRTIQESNAANELADLPRESRPAFLFCFDNMAQKRYSAAGFPRTPDQFKQGGQNDREAGSLLRPSKVTAMDTSIRSAA